MFGLSGIKSVLHPVQAGVCLFIILLQSLLIYFQLHFKDYIYFNQRNNKGYIFEAVTHGKYKKDIRRDAAYYFWCIEGHHLVQVETALSLEEEHCVYIYVCVYCVCVCIYIYTPTHTHIYIYYIYLYIDICLYTYRWYIFILFFTSVLVPWENDTHIIHHEPKRSLNI